MATAILKLLLPGLTDYTAGQLRLALWLESAPADTAPVVSNISLIPDAGASPQPDLYWATTPGFAGLCRAMVTEGSTVRASGYILMDDSANIHVLCSDSFIATIDGITVAADIATSSLQLVINSTAPVLATLDAAGKLTIHRGDITTFDLTLGNLAGRTGEKLIFTLKPRKDDLDNDSEAYLQVTELTGAVLVNGSSDGVVDTDASMTVLNEVTGQTRFVFKSDITDLLPIGTNFWYDVQMIDADGERITKAEDRAVVTRDVTRRTS